MANKFALDLRNEINTRFSADSLSMSCSDWICKNTTLKSAPFNFKRFPFQKTITDDMHPNLHVMKISQVGLTECQIRKAAAFCSRNRGVTVLMTFPNEAMMKKNAQTRVMPII